MDPEQWSRSVFFTDDIIGCIVDIRYHDSDGYFLCKVESYNELDNWHSVSSVNQSPGKTINFLTGQYEEEFTDEIDINVFWFDRRLQFVGLVEDAHATCLLCKLQASPVKLCVECESCGLRFHRRCIVSPGNKRLSGGRSSSPDRGLDQYQCAQCKSEAAFKRAAPPAWLSDRPLERRRDGSNTPITDTDYDSLDSWTDKLVSEVNAEFYNLQPSTARKFRLMSGPRFLSLVCGGNLSFAIGALQSCSTAGVLQWYYESGHEAENTKILKRGFDASDHAVHLLVVVPEVVIFPRPRNVLTLGYCSHAVLGFVAISGLLKTANTGDSQRDRFAQILLYAARSSHARSLGELVSAVVDRQGSGWGVVDTKTGMALSASEDVADQRLYCYQSSTHRGSAEETRRELGAVFLKGEEEIIRSEFDPRRFLFAHRGCQLLFINHEHLQAPGRLALAAAMRVLQRVNCAVLVLELALPLAECVRGHGQGRQVETVVSHGGVRERGREQRKVVAGKNWPSWLPKTGDLVLSQTSNVAAYKTYRAFGFCEHEAFNSLSCNAHPDYLYPVLGCALVALSWQQLRGVFLRTQPDLHGLKGWVARAREIQQLPVVLKRLIVAESSKRVSPWTAELDKFEAVLDAVGQDRLGCRPVSPRRSHSPAPSSVSFRSLPSVSSPASAVRKRRRRP